MVATFGNIHIVMPKGYKQRACVLIALLLLLPTYGRADTAIVVIWTRSRIIIAADSLSQMLQPPYTRVTKCKIIPAGNFFFTAAGITYFGALNPDDVFDVQASAVDAAKQGGNAIEIADRVERLIGIPLTNGIETLRAESAPDYQKRVNRGKRDFLNIIFAGIEQGKLVVHVRQFIATHNDPDPVTFRTTTQNCPRDCAPLHVIVPGMRDKIGAYLKSARGLDRMPPAQLARQLVQLEIDGVDADKPIDMLEITKTRARWIQHKKQCPEIQHQAKHTAAKSPPSNRSQTKQSHR